MILRQIRIVFLAVNKYVVVRFLRPRHQMYEQYAALLDLVNRGLSNHVQGVRAHIVLFDKTVTLAADKRRVRSELIVFFASVFGLDLADDGSFAVVCGLEGLIRMGEYLPALERYCQRISRTPSGVIDYDAIQQLIEKDLGISVEYVLDALTFLRDDFDFDEHVYSYSAFVSGLGQMGYPRLVEKCEQHVAKLNDMFYVRDCASNGVEMRDTGRDCSTTSSLYLADLVRDFMLDAFQLRVSPATMDACVEAYPLNYRDAVAALISDMCRDVPLHDRRHSGAHFAHAWINLRCFLYSAFGAVVRRDEIFEIL